MASERFFDRLYDLHDSDDVRRHYDQFAATYDAELTERGYAQPDRVAATLRAIGVASDARILDAGCGSGLSGKALAAQGYQHIVGCDYSSEMLSIAARTGVYSELFEVDLNAAPIHVRGAPYDVVTAVGVLGHGHVAGSAIGQMLELLRPDGVLSMAINGMAWPEGDIKPALDELVAGGAVSTYDAALGEHIPGLGSQGWVVTTRRT